MSEKLPEKARQIMNERFGHDTLLSLATTDGLRPSVRTVNAYYADGAFYVITYALSGKMQQIAKNPTVAVCGDWFTAHGIAENLGHILDPKNGAIAHTLRLAFDSWYHNGHVNESDPNTCILRIHLTDGVLLANGTRYDLFFTE